MLEIEAFVTYWLSTAKAIATEEVCNWGAGLCLALALYRLLWVVKGYPRPFFEAEIFTDAIGDAAMAKLMLAWEGDVIFLKTLITAPTA